MWRFSYWALAGAWGVGESGDQLNHQHWLGGWKVFVTCRYVEEDHRKLLYQMYMYTANPTFKFLDFVVQDSIYFVNGYLIDVSSI